MHLCSVKGCERTARAKDLCRYHYNGQHRKRRAAREQRTFPYRPWMLGGRYLHAQSFVRVGDRWRLVAHCSPHVALDPSHTEGERCRLCEYHLTRVGLLTTDAA